MPSKKKSQQRREDRRNQAKQARDAKRHAAQQAKRRGCAHDPPLMVLLAPLSATLADCLALRKLMAGEHAGEAAPYDLLAPLTYVDTKHKRRITAAIGNPEDLQTLLELAQLADVLVFVVSPHLPMTAHSELAVACIQAQGVPTVCHVITGLDAVPPKRRNDTKKELTKAAQAAFPDSRVQAISTPAEAENFQWGLTTIKQRPVRWRDARPHLLADSVDLQPQTPELGTLTVTGYLRGRDLDANRLVYLPGLGAFQLSLVTAPADPHPVSAAANGPVAPATEEVLAQPDPERLESLQTEVPIDPLAAEQTWPTGKKKIKKKKKNKKK